MSLYYTHTPTLMKDCIKDRVLIINIFVNNDIVSKNGVICGIYHPTCDWIVDILAVGFF